HAPSLCVELSSRFLRLSSVLRLVNVLADERLDVGRASDSREFRVKDEFRHAGGGLDFGFENVRLQGIQKSLLEQIGWDLVRHGLTSLDEHLVGDTFRLRGEDGHADRGEDVKVVRLPREEGLAVIMDWRELDAGSIDGLAFG